jgi:chromosome partitioning protein
MLKVAVNLAVEAEKKNLSTALIDLDFQSSSTEWSDIRKGNYPIVMSCYNSRMLQFIKKAEANNADYIFIDTAPHSKNSALEATRIANIVIILCRTDFLDMKTVQSTLNMLPSRKKVFSDINTIPSQP